MWDAKVHVGVAALILNPQRKLLMIKRGAACSHGAGQWSVPGGWIDEGETPETAVLRELKEEVGLIGQWPNLVGAVSNDHPSPVDTVICLFYSMPYTTNTMAPRIQEADKIDALRWVPVREVGGMNLFAPLQTLWDKRLLR